VTMIDNINLVDADDFLSWRRSQEEAHWKKADAGLLSSILTVEVNTTELCNRTCVFCPRHDPSVYPNRNLHMSMRGARRIAEELRINKFVGKVSFSGYSENLLNPYFVSIVEIFRIYLPDATLECNTNGDPLNDQYAFDLMNAGLDMLYVNLYDGPEQAPHFEKMLNRWRGRYKLRVHYGEDHGLILNNRGGNIDWIKIEDGDVASLQGLPCHYPFYKMFVDWNGDVLFCANDWGREHVVGNLLQQSMEEVWFSKQMNKIRKKLIAGNRDFSPCNKCSVNGTLFGKPSFDLIKEYYETASNR